MQWIFHRYLIMDQESSNIRSMITHHLNLIWSPTWNQNIYLSIWMDQFSIFHPAPLIIDPQKGLKKISVAELFTELILDKEKQCLYCEHGPPLSPEYL